jgi:hypothetical protein
VMALLAGTPHSAVPKTKSRKGSHPRKLAINYNAVF